MKSKLTVAVAAGLLALGAIAPVALAQVCGPGTMIEFDANAFAYETAYNPATLISSPGSQLNVVGVISLWCTPFADLNAGDPNTEYTFLLTGLTSGGTVVTANGPATFYDTNYSGGSFFIYAGSPRNAPLAATPMPPNPPNGQVPANFVDGTLILQGSLSAFSTSVSRIGAGSPNGGFTSNYLFTGPLAGTYFNRVAGTGPGLITGNWCVVTGAAGCVPQGYSAHPNGKFDQPPTAVRSGTWGQLKELYR